eukprot:m.158462 g.158462  ORF g.158462 m.158462 type:complete len:377 (-) comp17021_c0_seq5:754-1884(-)
MRLVLLVVIVGHNLALDGLPVPLPRTRTRLVPSAVIVVVVACAVEALEGRAHHALCHLCEAGDLCGAGRGGGGGGGRGGGREVDAGEVLEEGGGRGLLGVVDAEHGGEDVVDLHVVGVDDARAAEGHDLVKGVVRVALVQLGNLLAGAEVVEAGAKAPNVAGVPQLLGGLNLVARDADEGRAKVVGRAALLLRRLAVRVHQHAQPKVDEHNAAFLRHHNIGGLHVTMGNVDRVVQEGQGLETRADDVEEHAWVERCGVVADAAGELLQGAALDVVHDDAVADILVAVALGLLDKVVAVGDDARVEVRDGQQLQQIDLAPRKVVVLLQNLHAAELVALQMPGEHAFAVVALAKHADLLVLGVHVGDRSPPGSHSGHG